MDAAYREFLKSPEWWAIRAGALERSGNQCFGCESTQNLHVHHVSYKRVGGNEVPDDLMVLCRSCHRAVHNLPVVAGYEGRSQEVIDKIRAQTVLQRNATRKTKGRKSLAERRANRKKRKKRDGSKVWSGTCAHCGNRWNRERHRAICVKFGLTGKPQEQAPHHRRQSGKE